MTGITTAIFSGLVASFVSLVITTLVNFLFQRENYRTRLDSTLMQLNQVLLDNPYLENDQALQRYSERNSSNAVEFKDKYNIYCIMKYNYLQDFCKFYGFKRKRIEKRLHIKEYFTDNKEWWAENRKVNYEAYDQKFLHLIEEVVNGS